ncbi:NAD(P)/FAD-dependent oxidoreductase [bacterium]|nr:NAD(P)/FAD-dependent oxidoreductase [bacterium]
MNSKSPKKIVIIGGGASGFFAAIRCGEVARLNKVPTQITLLESSSGFLKKVKISGGGRCNVTHNQFEPRLFCENYPRGKKELRSPFEQFQAQDTLDWFKERGVKIVAEADGRMFPVTNNSQTIIDCYLEEAKKFNVNLKTNSPVTQVKKTNEQFEVHTKSEEVYKADSVLLATGSSPAGYKIAKSLGHKITDLAPSLFSFKIQDELLKDLSGTSFEKAKIKLKASDKKFEQEGPILITHWGLSGPAILKLSAWAAREMKASGYKAQLTVNWLGLKNVESALETLNKIKSESLKTHIGNARPKELTQRFWDKILLKAIIPKDKKWADISKKEIQKIAQMLFSYEFEVLGQNRFKEEFVECGGVKLKEVNFKTMESKICEGLYFSGELLDIDGITGGFNFQNAWTTGWIAGSHI